MKMMLMMGVFLDAMNGENDHCSDRYENIAHTNFPGGRSGQPGRKSEGWRSPKKAF